MSNDNTDQRFMKVAIEQAGIAEANGDVPIGAVIVKEGRIIAKAYNQREQLRDPTAHAEIIALTQGAAAMESWRLGRVGGWRGARCMLRWSLAVCVRGRWC